MSDEEFERRVMDVVYKAFRDGKLDPACLSEKMREEFELMTALDSRCPKN